MGWVGEVGAVGGWSVGWVEQGVVEGLMYPETRVAVQDGPINLFIVKNTVSKVAPRGFLLSCMRSSVMLWCCLKLLWAAT